MKLITLTLISLFFVSCKDLNSSNNSEISDEVEETTNTKQIAAVNLQTASFKIKGMTCAIGCAKTIEEELNALDGMQKATVDFDNELGKVTFDKTILNSNKIIKIVEAAADGKTYKVFDEKF